MSIDRVKQLEDIQLKAKNLFLKKNKDYGDAFADYGVVGVLVRIGDKLRRAQTISNNGINLIEDESIKDTLLDLHNYAAMAIMLLDESNTKDEYTNEVILESNSESDILKNTLSWTIKGGNGKVYIRKSIKNPDNNSITQLCSCPSFFYCKSKPQVCKHITSGIY